MPINFDRVSLPWLTTVMVALSATFFLDLWERPADLYPVEAVDSSFADPSTVRQSAAELIATDGDVSMLECYSCHERGQEPVLAFDEEGELIWEEHQMDFELRHGSKHRNNYCFNCHASDNLEMLKTRDGRYLRPEEGSVLCGSCHGTTYRDWEIGIHGRVNGYWNKDLGAAKRQDCTSCHNPHSPAFPSIEPAPGPQPLRGHRPDSLRTMPDSLRTMPDSLQQVREDE